MVGLRVSDGFYFRYRSEAGGSACQFDLYFGILKLQFFRLRVPCGGPVSLLAPAQTGRRPASAGQALVRFWPRSIHSFLAAALAAPQPSFGVLKGGLPGDGSHPAGSHDGGPRPRKQLIGFQYKNIL